MAQTYFPRPIKGKPVSTVKRTRKAISTDKKAEGGLLDQAPSKRSHQADGITRYLVEFGLVVLIYFLGGKIGLAVPYTSGNVSALWPPAGIAVAAMLVIGYRIWPAVAIGAFLVNFTTPIPPGAALGIAVGNTLGPMAGAWLLRRIPQFNPSLTRLRDVLGLICFAALGGTAISATLGTSVLYLAHISAWLNLGAAWRIWWLGDAMGVLIVTPLVLTVARLISMRQSRQLLEFAGILLGAAISCFLIFDQRLGFRAGGDIFAFGIFPFVIWGAIRFEAAGAAAVSFLISVLAVLETAYGFGPFVKSASLQSATLLQSFLAVISMSGMTVAALVAERSHLVRDQTAREGLEQSEKRYRGIVETGNEGIWKLDTALITRFVNRRMAELLGYTVDEMLGKPLGKFIFDDDVEQVRADLERRRTGVSEQLERRYRKKDGAELWTRVSASATFNDDGTLSGALAMVSDMTDQRCAETGRRGALEKVTLLSSAMEQTADSVVITDSAGVIGYVNPAFEATTGYTREEAIGKTPRILKSGEHDSAFYRSLWVNILAGDVFRGTLLNRKKTGETYWAEQTITPIKDQQGVITHFVSVLKDVTALRKQQEQEMQLRLARAVQQRFYRASLPQAGMDAAAAIYPAEVTSGDYFDFIPVPDGALVVIADVSGHDFGAALLMAMTRAYMRSVAATVTDVGEMLTRMNHLLYTDLEEDRFVTMILVHVNMKDRCLAYSSAGHVPGFVLNESGEIASVLESVGLPLGITPQQQYAARVMLLLPRQIIVLLTDGITESCNSDDVDFGGSRALDYARNHRQECAHNIADGICRAARSFGWHRPQADDFMAVVTKIL